MPSSTISIRVNGQWDGAALQSAIKDLESFGKTAKSSIGLYTSNAQKLAVETASLGDSVSKALTQSGTDMVKFGNNLQRVGNAAQDLGRQLTTSLTLPLVGVGTYAGAMAVQYDTAMANVRKVTDMTEAELDQLGESALELSTKQPVSAETILNVEALGAQLGIADNMLESFAQTVTGLDIATNLSADQAATDMARFANITGMADDKYQNFGSTIVALGNNLATTESEIANMSLRLAAAGDIAGMSEADILGMAGAMSSLGIRAEAGGSAMTTIMSKISKAVADGGSDLEAYAQVAGMSAGQFASAWQSAPMDAIISLLDGIKRLDEGGQDMNVTLSELGINEIRQSDAMRRLANDTGILKDAVNLANTAWQENTALTDEVSQRNESMASRLQVLKNRVDEIAINVGGPLVNALIDALDACQPLIDAVASAAQAFADADAGTQQMILGLAGLAAGAGPVINVMGKLSTGVGSVISSFGHAVQNIGVYNDALTTTDGAHVRNYQSADTFAARVGLLDNAILKASGDTDAYVRAWELAYDAQHRGAAITEQLAVLEGNLGNASGKTSEKIEAQIDSLNRQYAAANKTYDENRRLLDGWADMASQATKTEVSVTGLGSSFTDMAESAGDAAKESKKSGTAMKSIKSGASLAAASIGSFVKQAALMGGVTIAITAVTAAIGYLVNAAIEAEEHQKLLSDATRTFGEISEEAAAGAEAQVESFGNLREQIDETLQSLADINAKAAETMEEFQVDSATLDAYTSTIEQLAGQSGLTATEQERLKNAVAGYNEITGDSVEVTNASRGELSKSTEEILKNADAWERNARAQAYQELAVDYAKAQAQAALDVARAQEEVNAAQEAYNEDVQRLIDSGYDETHARSLALTYESGRALHDANVALNEAQGSYDSATQSLEELTEAQVMMTEEAQGMKDALQGFGDSFVDELASAGVGLDSLTVALADAGVSVEQLSELGSERIAAFAQAFDGNVEQMVWAIQNYNNVPLIDKDGNVTVNDQELIDAQGRVVVWNGTQFVYKDTQAAVNDADLIDAQGNLYTWNGSTLLPKSATGNIETNLPSVIAWRNDWNNGSLISKAATGAVTLIQNVKRYVTETRANAAGGIRYHADGAFIARSATPLDIVGENGAEAIVPLTNRRYSQPFADIIAEGVERRLVTANPMFARASSSQSSPGRREINYNLTINGERKGSMSAAALEAVEVLFNEFGLTSEMGVQ